MVRLLDAAAAESVIFGPLSALFGPGTFFLKYARFGDVLLSGMNFNNMGYSGYKQLS